jgi:hypothetical protein
MTIIYIVRVLLHPIKTCGVKTEEITYGYNVA